MLMRKILYPAVMLTLSAALFAQPRPENRHAGPGERPEPPRAERPNPMREKWENAETITLTGSIEYLFEEKEGERPEIRQATIEKEGILYKIHFPVHRLAEEAVEPGTEVTVTGKSIPSDWMNDDSVLVFADKIEAGDKIVEAPKPPRKGPEHRAEPGRHHPDPEHRMAPGERPDPEKRPAPKERPRRR